MFLYGTKVYANNFTPKLANNKTIFKELAKLDFSFSCITLSKRILFKINKIKSNPPFSSFKK